MLNDNNLTQAQRNLYFQLKRSIWNGRSISNILKAASRNDLLKVLITGYTTRFPTDGGRTLTLLSLAIHRDNNECVNSILIRAKNSSMLQDAFTEVSTVLFPYGRYTLNACELDVVVNKNNASIRTALDNVSISSRYIRENSKVN